MITRLTKSKSSSELIEESVIVTLLIIPAVFTYFQLSSLMCSQTFINLEHIKKLTVQNTHRRALVLIDNRQFIEFLHKQSLALSTDVNLLGLDEISSVDHNSGEMQTCNLLLLFGGDRLWRNPRKRVARGGKL